MPIRLYEGRGRGNHVGRACVELGSAALRIAIVSVKKNRTGGDG